MSLTNDNISTDNVFHVFNSDPQDLNFPSHWPKIFTGLKSFKIMRR